jgi:hypothetical protein
MHTGETSSHNYEKNEGLSRQVFRHHKPHLGLIVMGWSLDGIYRCLNSLYLPIARQRRMGISYVFVCCVHVSGWGAFQRDNTYVDS